MTWEMWGGASTELTTHGRDTSDSIYLPFNQCFDLVWCCHRAMQPRLNQTQDSNLKSSCLSLPRSWASKTVLPGLMATSYFIIICTTILNTGNHFFHSQQALDLALPLPCHREAAPPQWLVIKWRGPYKALGRQSSTNICYYHYSYLLSF